MNRTRDYASPNSPLAHSRLDVTITDLVAEHVFCHRFENQGKEAIEAVFSFPIPLDAAFLGMRATLGAETLEAAIQPRRQADRTYDDAIAEGHRAVLLSAPEPGLLCAHLGNLLPGETGEIELRFATGLRIADRHARFSLPLVHRPRYGQWRLEALETPTPDFAAEHRMSATIRVVGLLAAAPVTCATHAARFVRHETSTELSIAHAMLDRDLVLSFELAQDLAPVGRLIEDGDDSLGLVSFVLPRRESAAKPLDLCLVLDNSGSMEGDAIAQSRAAVLALLDTLHGDDRIQVLRFGSCTVPMFRRPLLATPLVRESLDELVPTLQANLGGTCVGDALERALKDLRPIEDTREEDHRSRAIILVTDGAVQPHDIAESQAAALKAGVRIFVVAVGSSAGTEVLEPLARSTGATMERAVPSESIQAGVMRQLRRARETEAVTLNVHWPDPLAKPIPIGVAYPGDAVEIATWIRAGIDGEVTVQAPSLDFEIRLPLGSRAAAPALRALVGLRRYRSAADNEREALALHYGLLAKETSAVLVKRCTEIEQATGLPRIVQIPQMVPEGMVVLRRPTVASLVRRAPPACMSSDYSYDEAGGIDAVTGMPVPFTPHYGEEQVRLAQHEDKEENTGVPVIPEARSILLALYRILLASLSQRPSVAPLDIPSAIDRLPKVMQEPARQLLKSFGLPLNPPGCAGDATGLLLALNTVLEQAPFRDDEEAMLMWHLSRDPEWNDPDAIQLMDGQLLDGSWLETDVRCYLEEVATRTGTQTESTSTPGHSDD